MKPNTRPSLVVEVKTPVFPEGEHVILRRRKSEPVFFTYSG